MRNIRWIVLAAALQAARCLVADSADGDLPPVFALPVPEQFAPFPDWVPVSVRGSRPGGVDAVLGMSSEWVVPPPAGRPGIVSVVLSNRTEQAVLAPHGSSPFVAGTGGFLCLAAGSGGSRTLLEGFPRRTVFGPDSLRIGVGSAIRQVFRLPPEVPSGAAGSDGLVVAYATRQESSGLAYWAECAPLPVPAAAPEPGVAGTNEWAVLRAYWVVYGLYPLPQRVLDDFPEFARFFPGVVLDATLPEAFRLEFAKRMPGVDAYDPGVLAFIQNAPDKDAPLVIAALNVLRRSRGGTPEEGAVRDTVDGIVYAMSLDPQHPLLFRLHAAHTFPVQSWYLEFMARTEPEFKLISAHGIREYDIEEYTEAKRNTIRAGLTPLLDNNTAFVAGPLQGQFPENVTIGQAAQSLLGQFEERWTANPPPE